MTPASPVELQPERRELTDRVCLAFHGFMKTLHAMDRPGWGDLDLTMSQLKTIMLLVETGGLTGRDLAERLGIGASAVTALVDRLVHRGYVRREEDRADRRVSWARPTERAIELFERLHATHRERLAEVLATLSEDDLALVAQAITTLELAAARQAGVTPPSRTVSQV
jgi:DNA-binding MarR family transcriptional regulator